MSCCGGKKDPILGVSDSCCTSTTGCSNNFDRKCLSDVKVEPIFVQKVYDAALVQSQAMIGGTDIAFTPSLPADSRIVEVLDIRCRRFGASGAPSLTLNPNTTFQGATLGPRDLIGPDGTASQRTIYVDTETCDEKCKGTPIYGTQTIAISGAATVEMDVLVRKNCGNRCKFTLTGTVPVTNAGAGVAGTINSMNFFELCVPSTTGGAFLPRFTEFCNISCQARLVTNSIERDFTVTPAGAVTARVFVALCISCEKKIIVPVQLCVLSTGFPQLSPEESSICDGKYPSLFPNQTDSLSVRECLDAKKDEGGCHKPKRPNHNPRYQGLSLSDDNQSEEEDI